MMRRTLLYLIAILSTTSAAERTSLLRSQRRLPMHYHDDDMSAYEYDVEASDTIETDSPLDDTIAPTVEDTETFAPEEPDDETFAPSDETVAPTMDDTETLEPVDDTETFSPSGEVDDAVAPTTAETSEPAQTPSISPADTTPQPSVMAENAENLPPNSERESDADGTPAPSVTPFAQPVQPPFTAPITAPVMSPSMADPTLNQEETPTPAAVEEDNSSEAATIPSDSPALAPVEQSTSKIEEGPEGDDDDDEPTNEVADGADGNDDDDDAADSPLPPTTSPVQSTTTQSFGGEETSVPYEGRMTQFPSPVTASAPTEPPFSAPTADIEVSPSPTILDVTQSGEATVDSSPPIDFPVESTANFEMRGGATVGGGTASFASTLSGDGSTIAMASHIEPDIVRVVVHRSSPDETWTQVGDDITGTGSLEGQGRSLALSRDGNILAVGFYEEDCELEGQFCGHVIIYKYDNGWNQMGEDIVGEKTYGFLGWSVALSDDGTTLAAGAPISAGQNGDARGKVRLFRFDSNSWIQLGKDLEGEADWDYLGRSVALSGDGAIIACGAQQSLAGDPGYVKVFSYDDTTDTFYQIGENIMGDERTDSFGASVSLSEDGLALAVGAIPGGINGEKDEDEDDEADSGPDFGVVTVYTNSLDGWVQVGNDIESGVEGDLFGFSVALNAVGNMLVVGAPACGTFSGCVSVFDLMLGSWEQLGDTVMATSNDKLPNEMGRSVSISKTGNEFSVGGTFGAAVYEVPPSRTTAMSRARHADAGAQETSRVTQPHWIIQGWHDN